MESFNLYYNNNIQLAVSVIKDVLTEIDIINNINNTKNLKMLVFGLGYDSKLWYNSTKGNTFFVENNKDYIELNKDHIPSSNIIYYDYKNITVDSSFNISEKDVDNFVMPNELRKLDPFDIIIIDGPAGWYPTAPGRLLPIYWSSKFLCKQNTLIYIDDSNRKLEKYCIDKYLSNDSKYKQINYFPNRDGTVKIQNLNI